MVRSAPFVLLFSALAAGVWFASQYPVPIWLSAAAACLAAAGAWLARRNAPVAGSLAWLMLFALGCARVWANAPPASADDVSAFNGRFAVVEGVVVDEPDRRATYTGLRVEVRRLVSGADDVAARGLLLVRADPSILWQYGDAARAFGTLDAPPILAEFDYRDYLARKGIRSWMARPEQVQRVGAGGGDPLFAAILRLRAALRLASQQAMPSPESALLNGILIGDDNEIPPAVAEAFRRTGTSHIVSISGFNVSLVIAMIVPALSRALNKRRAAAVAIPVILAYVVLVGASASVVRAGAMAILALVGQLLWRRGFTLNTLCAAGFILVALDPDTLFDGGFQLSFAATLGLVLYADRITWGVQRRLARRFDPDRARRWTQVLADILLVTLAAQITTLPLVLANFRQLSLVTLLTNALILPLQPAVMILGMLASLAGLLAPAIGAPALAGLAALPAYALLTATLRVVEWTGALPWASIPIHTFGAPAAAAWYGGLLAWTAVAAQPAPARHDLLRFARARVKPGAILLAALMAAVIGGVAWFQQPDGRLHVSFAGAGAFIQTPSGRQVVFAGGGGVLPIMGRAMPLADRGLELLIVPRRDDWALADTLPCLQRYQVGVVLLPQGEDEPSATLAEWQSTARAQAGRVLAVPAGTRVTLEPGVVLTVEERPRGAIGARLTHGDVTFELAGDAGVVSGTLAGGSIVFAGVKGASAGALNAAGPRWVVWADAGGAPPRLDAAIRAVALRDAGAVEFVSDGRTATPRSP
jgi:competence protein ComEC